MPENSVRAVVAACMIEWLQDDNAQFNADVIGGLLKKHAPASFTVNNRMHAFVMLAALMRFIADASKPSKPINTNAFTEMVVLGSKGSYQSSFAALGLAVDVKA